ncbi:MAG: hypothetical protein PHN98_12005 [Smithellaceae bacterium]|nr:hypothetical protein [Smithellaceae bacterium]
MDIGCDLRDERCEWLITDFPLLLAAGCHDYIAKPIHVNEFIEKIAGYFTESGPTGKEP